MSTTRSDRESGFLCSFTTPRGRGRAWVRAWSAAEASARVERQLRDEGVAGVVEVRVVEQDGAPARGRRRAH